MLSGWDLRQVVETCGYHVVGALVDVDQGFKHMKKISLLTTASRLPGCKEPCGCCRVLRQEAMQLMDQAESGRGCWVDRPAASATDVSAFVIGVRYLCFHHHANNSASTRAAQWPAPSPDMTGLVAAGANPLSKGRVPAQLVALDYP